MGPNDLGKVAVEKLTRVHNDTDFCVAVINFDSDHFQYDDPSKVIAVTGDWYNTCHDYLNKWGSDYVYIKNLTSETRYFVTPDGFVALPPEEILTLCFGKLTKPQNNKFNSINVGDIVTVADIEWIVLKKNDDSVFCLTKDFIDITRFDPDLQNYAVSEIRTKLQNFAQTLKYKLGENALIPRIIDLTTNNRETYYGRITESIGFLTENEYKKFESIIKKCPVKNSWWLATADSRRNYTVRCVYSNNGTLNYDCCNFDLGVRPACLFSAKIFEE